MTFTPPSTLSCLRPSPTSSPFSEPSSEAPCLFALFHKLLSLTQGLCEHECGTVLWSLVGSPVGTQLMTIATAFPSPESIRSVILPEGRGGFQELCPCLPGTADRGGRQLTAALLSS